VLRLHLVQLDLRKHWDNMYLEGAYKLEVTPDIRVVYYAFSAPWPVSSRDFCCIAGESIDSDGIVVSAVKSIKRDDVPERGDVGYVRGILGPTGFVLKPIENDSKGKPQCLVAYCVHIDPQGMIPTMIVNLVNGDQPLVINKLAKVVDLTIVVVKETIEHLLEIKDKEWKAPAIKKAINQAILDHDDAPPEMLWDPLRYLITGQRTGDVSVTATMEKFGKNESLKKLWIGVRAYAKSTGDFEFFKKLDAMGLL